jgi:hypothetical protein
MVDSSLEEKLSKKSRIETCYHFGRQLCYQEEILAAMPPNLAVLVIVYLGDILYPPLFTQDTLICTKVTKHALNCVNIEYRKFGERDKGLTYFAQQTIIQEINEIIKDRRYLFFGNLPRVGPYATAKAKWEY